MRRRLPIKRVLASLVLGAIPTVGVAWVFAALDIADDGATSSQQLYPIRGPIVHPYKGGPPNGLSAVVYRSAGAILVGTQAYGPSWRPPNGFVSGSGVKHTNTPPEDLVPWWARADALSFLATEQWLRDDENIWCGYQASGWPFPALCTVYHDRPSSTGEWDFGLVLSNQSTRQIGGHAWSDGIEIVLPLKPVLHGFILNTLLSGAAFYLLFTASVAIRQRCRARRNLCVRCAYDLSGTAAGLPCPECGEVAESRRPKGPVSQEPITHN